MPDEVHVWSLNLDLIPEDEYTYYGLLSDDEGIKARRYRLATHQRRSMLARAYLRIILSLYLNVDPKIIVFAYHNRKPGLVFPKSMPVNFNLSHSHDLLVIGVTLNHALGIDVEKIDSHAYEEIAARHFSYQEKLCLSQLSESRKKWAFYNIWSRKEAVLKAAGIGLSIPLSSLSVPISDQAEWIELLGKRWYLLSLLLHPHYACALASSEGIRSVSQWNLIDRIPKLIKVLSIS